jgi:hypothetical protein
MDSGDLERELDAIVSGEIADAASRSAAPPEVLYQYSDGRALRGIVGESRVWATHCDFLNDAQELRYAAGIVADYLTKRSADVDGMAALVHAVEREFKHASFDVYVSCFSEDGDSLSQWRGYANDGSGFAVGVDLRSAPSVPPGEGFTSPSLFKVEYDLARMRQRVEKGIGAIVDVIARWDGIPASSKEEDDRRKTLRVAAIMRLTALYGVHFKMSGFREEREWRLAVLTTSARSSPIVKFRDSRYGMAPYVELALSEQELPCPVRQIVLGPKQEHARSARAVSAFLEQHQCHHAKVVASKVSYR